MPFIGLYKFFVFKVLQLLTPESGADSTKLNRTRRTLSFDPRLYCVV